ncbi:MAG: thioredoxin-disulfide reductase [Bacteroidetes bacterium]|nr:thioredoxin-disulfide reductase [Bacteroidota bacterium]
MQATHFDSIIIGAGPAGLTAGIYLSRAKANVLILDSGVAGGQMVLTHEIANYPGFESISGYELATRMKNQAKNFGCKLMSGVSIEAIDFESERKWLRLTNGKEFTSDSIILATGGRSKSLGVPGEDKFRGRGISYCATCDGDFFTGKTIAVVGGGNTALEEADSLTKYASHVTIIHMLDTFQGFRHAQEVAYNNPKIDIRMQSRITEFLGDDKLEAVMVENLLTGEHYRMELDGVFVFIGYEANTDFLKGKCIALNERGEVMVDSAMQTNVPGVFAAGDANAKRYRQITLATADGTIAALSAMEYLNKLKMKHVEA